MLSLKLNIQISDKDWHDPLDKMQIAIFMQSGGYAPYWSGFGHVRNDISVAYLSK